MGIRPRNFRISALAVCLFVSVPTVFAGPILPGFESIADGRNDDGTYTDGGCNNPSPGGTCDGTPVPLGFSILFAGNWYSALYINTNGNVTFDGPLAAFVPFGLDFAFQPIIAPFFADIDTRNPLSGTVTFGPGTVDGRPAFGVNWINVGYFDQAADRTNSFQLLIVDRSDIAPGQFDVVFNYDRILFEAGDASFGSGGLGGLTAHAGFSTGTGLPGSSFSMPGSGDEGAFLEGGSFDLPMNSLNDGNTGRYVLGVREDLPVPEPGSLGLLGCGALLVWSARMRGHRR